MWYLKTQVKFSFIPYDTRSFDYGFLFFRSSPKIDCELINIPSSSLIKDGMMVESVPTYYWIESKNSEKEINFYFSLQLKCTSHKENTTLRYCDLVADTDAYKKRSSATMKCCLSLWVCWTTVPYCTLPHPIHPFLYHHYKRLLYQHLCDSFCRETLSFLPYLCHLPIKNRTEPIIQWT